MVGRKTFRFATALATALAITVAIAVAGLTTAVVVPLRNVMAWPDLLDCDTIDTWEAGNSFPGTRMNVGSFTDGGNDCSIRVQDPEDGDGDTEVTEFKACKTYTVSISGAKSAHKINARAGTLSGSGSSETSSCRNERSRNTEISFDWNSPNSGESVEIKGLCGEQDEFVRVAKITLDGNETSVVDDCDLENSALTTHARLAQTWTMVLSSVCFGFAILFL